MHSIHPMRRVSESSRLCPIYVASLGFLVAVHEATDAIPCPKFYRTRNKSEGLARAAELFILRSLISRAIELDMDDALHGIDSYRTTDRSIPVPTLTGCHWCNGNGEAEEGPCERSSCQDEAEDDYRADRRVACRAKAEECYRARTGAFAMAARYILEGDSLTTPRTRDAREQAASWQAQGDAWMAKARGLASVSTEERSAAQ